jgi:capsular polysaccharide transport system permease protein
LSGSDREERVAGYLPPLVPREAAAEPWRAFLRVQNALILREVATRYGRTPGGFVWAILEPVAAVLVLSAALSMVVQAPSLGTSFVIFYASGYLPFLFYATLQGHVQQALVYSRPLLVYPSVSWIDAIAARFALNAVTGLAVVAIVLSGLAIATGELRIIAPGQVVLALSLAALLGLGLGVLNCLLIGLFPLWGQVWAILSRPLFLVAGVIFVMEDLPPRLQDWLYSDALDSCHRPVPRGISTRAMTRAYASVTLVLTWALVPAGAGPRLPADGTATRSCKRPDSKHFAASHAGGRVCRKGSSSRDRVVRRASRGPACAARPWYRTAMRPRPPRTSARGRDRRRPRSSGQDRAGRCRAVCAMAIREIRDWSSAAPARRAPRARHPQMAIALLQQLGLVLSGPRRICGPSTSTTPPSVSPRPRPVFSNRER